MQQCEITSAPRRHLVAPVALALLLGVPLPAIAGDVRLEVATKEPVGEYITDSKGMALYLFEKDGQGRSTCYDACASAWPPLLAEDEPATGMGLDANKLSTVPRKDGSRQVTYGGHPLYYFVKDKRPGDIEGQDVEGFGAEWYLVSPAGKAAESEEEGHEEDGY